MGVTAGPQSIVTDGLVLYLDAGNTKSYSDSGNKIKNMYGSNDVSLMNGTLITNVNMIFDGIDDYAITNTDIIGNSPISICFWANYVADQSSDRVLAIYGKSGTAGQCAGIYYRNSNTFVRFTGWSDASWDYNTSFLKDFNVWHFWTIIYSNNTVNIYRDGIPDANGVKSKVINFTTNQFTLSCLSNNTYANVKISTAAIYARALSDAEVLQNYNALKSRFKLP